MTTEQLDHLRLLKAHLENLLAKAAERTPGEWEDQQSDGIYNASVRANQSQPWTGNGIASCFTENDASFIAACAGNAEAGWRSTLGVIKRYYDSGICREWQGYMQTAIEPILAEWPLESLKTN